MKSISRFLLSALAVLAVVAPAAADRAAKPPARPLLTATRGRLYLGKLPFRNVGVNIPDLFDRFLLGQTAAADASLSDAKHAGALFVRCCVISSVSDGFGVFETDRARWFAAFGRMLGAVDSHGMALIPSLLADLHAVPDYVRKTSGVDEQSVDLMTHGTRSNGLAVAYITAVVTRYRADPRVLLWEIGDEYNLEADLPQQWKRRPANDVATSDEIHDFLFHVATVIKKSDRAHLISSGCADMRPAAWHMRSAMRAHRPTAAQKGDSYDFPMESTRDTYYEYSEMLAFFNPAPLDLVSVHCFPPSGASESPFWTEYDAAHAYALPWAAYAAAGAGKPLFIGAFGQKVLTGGKEQPALWNGDILQRMLIEQAPLAAVWSWESPTAQPEPGASTLSPLQTPSLVKLLTETNSAIHAALVSEAIAMHLLPEPKHAKVPKPAKSAVVPVRK